MVQRSMVQVLMITQVSSAVIIRTKKRASKVSSVLVSITVKNIRSTIDAGQKPHLRLETLLHKIHEMHD